MNQGLDLRVFFVSKLKIALILNCAALFFSFGTSVPLLGSSQGRVDEFISSVSNMSEYRILLQWQFTRGRSKERVRIDSVSENYTAEILVKFSNPTRCSLTLSGREPIWANCDVPLQTSSSKSQEVSMRIQVDERDFVKWLGLGQEFSSVASDEPIPSKTGIVTLNVWSTASKSLETWVKSDDELSSLLLRGHAQLILRKSL